MMPLSPIARNPMMSQRPAAGVPEPKWMRSVGSLYNATVGALMAPGNALAGNYPILQDPSAPGGIDQFSPMIPDAMGLAGMMTLGSGAIPAEADALNMGIKAYHGSPHSFDKFDMSKIGTGEGAQAYGHGLYFAGNEGVAKGYQNKLAQWTVDGGPANPYDPSHIAAVTLKAHDGDAAKAIADLSTTASSSNAPNEIADAQAAIDLIKNKTPLPRASGGSMYAVELTADPSQLLDWDKPISQQSPETQAALSKFIAPLRQKMISDASQWGTPSPEQLAAYGQQADQIIGNMTGEKLYNSAVENLHLTRQPAAPFKQSGVDMSAQFKKAGIPGIQYLDAGSRAAGDGTRNYVMFDDNLINVLKKYGIAAPVVGGAGLAAASQMQPPTGPLGQTGSGI